MRKLKSWKKGQSGNPLGAQKHDPVKRALKRLTSSELADIGTFIILDDIESLKKVARSTTETALRVMIANVVLKAIKGGDPWRMNAILDRIVGKVPQPLASPAEIQNGGNGQTTIILKYNFE